VAPLGVAVPRPGATTRPAATTPPTVKAEPAPEIAPHIFRILLPCVLDILGCDIGGRHGPRWAPGTGSGMGSGSLSEFGPLLRSRRLAAALTQAELAERSGVSERTIRSLERAVSRPYLKTVALLAEAMGLAADGQDELARAARPDAQIQAQSGVHAPGQAAPHQLPGAV
jgi:DNA-binding XRE family transcriptional regulator